MRYLIVWVLVVSLISPLCVFAAKAKEEAKKEQTELTFPSMTDSGRQEKELLIANLNNLRNQELRVAVLQQLLGEEINKLRNVQALFCDQYKLDVDKFRQGLYRYDEQKARFVEINPADTSRQTK
jgi:hypothetical protein